MNRPTDKDFRINEYVWGNVDDELEGVFGVGKAFGEPYSQTWEILQDRLMGFKYLIKDQLREEIK